MDLIKIGVIDDDWQDNPDHVEMNNRSLARKRDNIQLVLIPLKSDINEVISNILSEKCDGLIVDQKLNGKLTFVSYNGTEITEKINLFKNIPYLFWTSDPSNVKDLCLSSEVGSIYDHSSEERLIDSDMFRDLILKIKKYRDEINEKEKRLLELLSISKPNPQEVEEIDFLDSEIEKSIIKTSPLNKEIRKLNITKINKTIDAFLEKFGNDEIC